MSRLWNGRTREGQTGFTLIELLIVVAIVGLISAIAVVNLLNAVDKAKQKRTMADMRTIGAAVEAYGTDNARYPVGVTTWPAMKGHLNPHFMKAPPDTDGWMNGWEVSSETGDDYSIISTGKDGAASTRAGGPTQAFDCDILFVNGQFYQWPQGTQS
jgi:type II secretion system protein G